MTFFDLFITESRGIGGYGHLQGITLSGEKFLICFLLLGDMLISK